MSSTESGNDRDNRLHGEMVEIKELLKVLIQSQAKQAESQDKLADSQARQIESQEKLATSQAQQAKAHAQSQAQQAKSQENIQNQMLEVLRSISNKQQEKDIVKNNSADSKEITKASGVDEKQTSKVVGKGTVDIKNTGKDTTKPLPAFDNLPQAKDTIKNNTTPSKEITKASGSSGEEKPLIKKTPTPLPAYDNLVQGTIKNNNTVHSNNITKASGSGEITKASGSGTNTTTITTEGRQPSKAEEKVVRATYKPDRDDLLLKGDCEKTIEFLKSHHEALTHGVTRGSHTVLHVAIFKKRGMVLIEEIVKLMSPEVLEYKAGDHDYTALHQAAQYGNVPAVKLLVKKNPMLPRILDKRGFTPLDIALREISIDQKETVEYLYSITKDIDPSPFTGGAGAFTLCKLIECNFYDIALCLVLKFPKVATTKSTTFDMGGLEMMVRRPFAFKSGAKMTWWQSLIYSSIQVDMDSPCIESTKPAECIIEIKENPLPANLNVAKVEESSKVSLSTTCKGLIVPYLARAIGSNQLYNQKLVHQQAVALIKQLLVEICKFTTLTWYLNKNPNIMKIAIKHGIIEIVEECLEKSGNIIWERIEKERMIETAVIERKEVIVNLLCETGEKLKDKIDLISRTDLEKNTILHYAARIAPLAQLNLVSGAALQMQREMQWFTGIESILPESHRFKRNKKGDTAQFEFTEAHKDLVKEGRDWLKDTSGSCMIVAALIATVAFAAAFTVPGGNISDTGNTLNGTPIFLGKSSFTVFAVADALALFSSITSVLMFLAIYTSRFAEMDFLKSLPQKLIFGLATLFLSMVAILVAFGASLFIVVGSWFAQALVPITLLSCCPLGLFAWLQFPLFVEMVRSTYWGSLFKKHRYIDLSALKNDNKSRKKKKEN